MGQETSETVYGRLLESVHITGYSMERACAGLEFLLEDGRWKSIGDGFDDINDFLRTIDLSQFKIAVDRRKALSRRLDDMQASQRATANALGVTNETIRRDIGRVTNVTFDTESKKPIPQVVTNKEVTDATLGEFNKDDTNVTLQRPNPLSTPGTDAARSVEKQATKKWDKEQQYGHDQGDEWYTPKWLFDSLGLVFNIDVCAPVDLTHITTPAKLYFNEEDDGLSKEWEGLVWCNPPYSAPEAWADKCIEHSNGLLLTHIPMNAAWAQRVWTSCNGIRLFQAIEFTRPTGEKQRPGSWLQLAAFGDVACKALAGMTTPSDVAENPRRVPSPMWVKHG